MSAVITSTGITIEAASDDDLAAAAEVYQAAAQALSDQLRAIDPWTSVSARQEDLRLALATLGTLVEDHPGSVIVARDAGRIVGMAAVQIQDPHAHIAFFFVHPDAQNRGIGRTLLHRLREVIDQAGATVTTLVASRDPRAWQRYLRFGLRPGPPVMAFRAPQPRFPPKIPPHPGLSVRPLELADLDRVATLDQVVRGAWRWSALERWIADGSGILAIDRSTRELAGYALVSARSRHCQVGPVVARHAGHAVFMLELALFLAGTHPNPGRHPWRVDCSARNHVAVEPLLRAGFGIDGLVAWFETGPIGQWDRYIFRDEDAL